MDSDPWLAPDKFYHLLFCLFLNLFVSVAASLSRYSFLRRYSVPLGSIVSLFAGAAKEAADQIGLFPSSGASFRDGVADVVGVLIAASALSYCKPVLRHRKSQDSETQPVSIV